MANLISKMNKYILTKKEQKQVKVIKEAAKDVLKSKSSSMEFLRSAGIIL